MMREDLLKAYVAHDSNRSRLYVEKGYWTEETITMRIDYMAQRFPDRECLVGEGQRYTYSQLKNVTDRLALHMIAMGLRKGERLIVQINNIPEFMLVYLAVQKIGVIPVLCLPQQRYSEISQIAASAEAVGYIAVRKIKDFDYKDLIDQVADERHMRYKMIAGEGQDVPEGYISINELMKKPAPDEDTPGYIEQFRPDPRDISVIFLSGGTTGTPKLIPREYNYWRHFCDENCREIGYTMYTVALALAPLAHDFSLGCPGIQGAMMYGGKAVVTASNDTENICKVIEQERVTVAPMVSAMIIKMLNFEGREKYDLSSWKIVINGASKLEPVVAARLKSELGVSLISQYGITESTVTQTALDDDEDVILNTIGLPVCPGDEWKIIDPDDGHIIAESDGMPHRWRGEAEVAGELIFRSAAGIAGYYNAPDRNKEAFWGDGFYRSGDLACMHKSGRGFVIMGRLKDAINRGGEKINCEEVENLVLEIKKVHNCALVPMPDPVLGERACLFVMLRDPKDTLTLEEITQAIGGKIAKYKLPERLEIRDALAETNVGKINKKVLKAEIAEIIKKEQDA